MAALGRARSWSRSRPRFSPSRRSPVSRRDWSRLWRLDRGRRRSGAAVGGRVRRLLQAGFRRARSAGGEASRPPCARWARARSCPAGGLIGPTMGAWSTSNEKPSLSQLTRSTITFVILTNAPGAIVLAAVGTLLWLGLPSGPHQAALTILPALIAVGLLDRHMARGALLAAANAPAARQAGAPRALAKPHRGDQRRHQRRPRAGHAPELEARRCARLLRLRQRRALGGLPCLRPRPPHQRRSSWDTWSDRSPARCPCPPASAPSTEA